MATENKLCTNLREQELRRWMEIALDMGEDARQTKGNRFMYPCVDEEGNERFMEITVSVPVGGRYDEERWNGYDEAENYKMVLAEQEEKKKIAAERKALKAKEAKMKREEAMKKKAEKELAKQKIEQQEGE